MCVCWGGGHRHISEPNDGGGVMESDNQTLDTQTCMVSLGRQAGIDRRGWTDGLAAKQRDEGEPLVDLPRAMMRRPGSPTQRTTWNSLP